MLVVHHLNNSRSQRILWLLEELGVDYQIKQYQRDAETNLAPASLKEVHPLGKAPVITDGDIVVAESGAIIEYLIDTYGAKFSTEPGSEKQRQSRYWVHFSEGSLMPPLVAKLVFDKVRANAKPFFVRAIANKIADKVMSAYFGPNIAANMALIESHLQQHEWFAGDAISAADFQMIFPLEAMVARGAATPQSAIGQYVKKVHERETYQNALNKGGQYDYA